MPKVQDDSVDDQVKPILWAGILVIRNRRVLTVKERDKPFYIMPGGKLEPGETDEEAAARETFEELGVKADIGKPFGEFIENSKNTGKLIRFKLFRAKLSEDPSPVNYPKRTEDVAYINSQYSNDGIDVGNLLIQLLPDLVQKDLID